MRSLHGEDESRDSAVAPRAEQRAIRQRKAHRKSRRGCGNCKLRKVKCDESKPHCARCTSFGVSCNYGRPQFGTRSRDLEAAFRGAFQVELSPRPAVSANDAMLAAINHSLSCASGTGAGLSYIVTHPDLDIVQRFTARTVLGLGNSRTQWIYQAVSSRLIYQHPFLLHAALALTLFHDRMLQSSPPPPSSRKELLHRVHGTKLLSRKLDESSKTTPQERDALWITAILLGTISLTTADGQGPEDSWPLTPPGPTDLHWLGMAEGKREVWRLIDLPQPGSGLNDLVEEEDLYDAHKVQGQGLRNLPPALLALLRLEPPPAAPAGRSSPSMASLVRASGGASPSGPYAVVAEAVGRLMPIPCEPKTMMRFLVVLSLMSPPYRTLLHAKDPGALVLLAYWWAKVSQNQHWWTWRRSVNECQAICFYLERHHRDLPRLDELLEFPRRACPSLQGRSCPESFVCIEPVRARWGGRGRLSSIICDDAQIERRV